MQAEDTGSNSNSQLKNKAMISSGFPWLEISQQMLPVTDQLFIWAVNTEFEWLKN